METIQFTDFQSNFFRINCKFFWTKRGPNRFARNTIPGSINPLDKIKGLERRVESIYQLKAQYKIGCPRPISFAIFKCFICKLIAHFFYFFFILYKDINGFFDSAPKLIVVYSYMCIYLLLHILYIVNIYIRALNYMSRIKNYPVVNANHQGLVTWLKRSLSYINNSDLEKVKFISHTKIGNHQNFLFTFI